MKSLLAATALLCSVSGAANAATQWMGNVFFSYKCTAAGGGGVDWAEVVFSPKGLTGNNAQHDMVGFFPSGKLVAMQFLPTQTSGLLNGEKSVAVDGIDKHGYVTGKMTMSKLAIQPAAPKKTNPYVTVSIQFTQEDGCIATGNGTLVYLGG